MAIVGNNSTATAVTSIGPVSVNAGPAPFDGVLVSSNAWVIFGVNNGGFFTLNGAFVAITGGMPSFTPFGISTGPVGPGYRAGDTITLTFQGGGLSSGEVEGASVGAWDLWADFQPAPVPGAPSLPPAAVPLTINTWRVTPNAGGAGIVSSVILERSQDGGASWATAATLSPLTTTYVDTVSAGPLAYRARCANTTGASAPGPVFTCAAPPAPTTPAIAPLTMTTWQVNMTGAGPLAVQYEVERSQNGGASWSVDYTGAVTNFVSSVSPGALQFRERAQNSVGDGVSGVAVAPSPTAPVAAPTYSELLD